MWFSLFDQWIWTLGILGLGGSSDSYSELAELDRWHVGLQALAFNQRLQWQHVGWNQTITLYQVTGKLRAFTKSQRTQTFTVTFPWQCVHQYGEKQQGIKPVQLFSTGESLRWRKTTSSEDAITYTCQIWPWRGIWTYSKIWILQLASHAPISFSSCTESRGSSIVRQ